jgi:hypothetical protein
MSEQATPKLSSVGGNAVGLAISFAFPLIAGAAIGTSVAYLAVRPQWGDQTWLLFLAHRLLEGARLGVDVFEPNPPLIIWLTELPVLIGRALDIRLTTALQVCLALLVVLSVGWSTILLRRGEGADGRRFAGWFALAMLFALVVDPWVHQAQREHIMLLLVLPYVVMTARRMEGKASPPGEAVLAGLCAGVGFLLKPHHLLVVVLIEGLLLVRYRSLRTLGRPESAAMMATGLAYAIALWLWAPDYLRNVVPLAVATYYDFHRVELSEVILPMRALKIVLMVLLWAALYRWLAHRALATLLVLAGTGATLAFAAQMKADEYQFIPAVAYLTLMLAVIAIDCWSRWATPRLVAVPAGLATAGATCTFLAALAIHYPLQVARAAHAYTDDHIEVQRQVSPHIPRRSVVLILSTATESFFEQVLDRDWQWGSRFFCLWMLPSIIKAERTADSTGTQEPEAIRNGALLTRNAMLADLTHWRPNPVLVDRCADTSIAPCMGAGALRFDILHWLSEDPRFADAWTNYVREGQVGPYDLWCQKGEEDVCRRILARPLAKAASPPT